MLWEAAEPGFPPGPTLRPSSPVGPRCTSTVAVPLGTHPATGHRLPARSLDLAHGVSRRQYNINQGIDECCTGRLMLRSHQLLLPWL